MIYQFIKKTKFEELKDFLRLRGLRVSGKKWTSDKSFCCQKTASRFFLVILYLCLVSFRRHFHSDNFISLIRFNFWSNFCSCVLKWYLKLCSLYGLSLVCMLYVFWFGMMFIFFYFFFIFLFVNLQGAINAQVSCLNFKQLTCLRSTSAVLCLRWWDLNLGRLIRILRSVPLDYGPHPTICIILYWVLMYILYVSWSICRQNTMDLLYGL